MTETTFLVQPGVAYTFEFTNYKANMTQRVVLARGLHWGMTPWHKDLQFFLEAFDIEKKEVRQFPLAGMRIASFRRYTDEELDVFLTKLEQVAEARGVQKGLAEAEEAEDEHSEG